VCVFRQHFVRNRKRETETERARQRVSRIVRKKRWNRNREEKRKRVAKHITLRKNEKERKNLKRMRWTDRQDRQTVRATLFFYLCTKALVCLSFFGLSIFFCFINTVT
jgi:hypothetical protein